MAAFIKTLFGIATATAGLAAVVTAVYAQEKFDKYSLKSPNGIAFSDFEGYEDWAVVSSSMCRTPLRRPFSSTRTASAFRTPAAGDTRCSTTTSRPARWSPTRRRQIAGTHAMWR